MSTVPTPTHAHTCSGCGHVSLESAAGFKRLLGRHHASFWNGTPACQGSFREATALEFENAIRERTARLIAEEEAKRAKAATKERGFFGAVRDNCR
jgi:hypothetical protein